MAHVRIFQREKQRENEFLSHVHTHIYIHTYIRTTIAECALLNDKIYCYGGGQPVVNKADPQSMEDFQYLDVSQSFAVSQSSAAWTSLSTNGSVDPEPNFLFNMIAIPDSNSLFMDGGLGYNNGTGLLHQAKAYDVDQNSWSVVSTPAGMLQTYVKRIDAPLPKKSTAVNVVSPFFDH